MKIFGIFGDPITHSLSPAMQNKALRALGEDACYHAFRVAQEDLEDALLGAAAMGFAGLNLTIPLKEKALELDFLQPDPLAQAIGEYGELLRAAGPRGLQHRRMGRASGTTGCRRRNQG
jgi:shikimate dehydrogenase